MDETNGTMTIPKRSLTVMIDTLPNFSGKDGPDTVSWLEFQIAMDQLKELHNFNKKDAVVQFLNKLHEPAKLLIVSKDTQKSVKDIFEKLKAVYGTPQKVLSRIVQDLIKIGAIPETGMGKIFQTLSQHQDLLDKTNTFLNSFQGKDTAETTIILRQHAYDLYMMLPQTIINQTNKHLVQQGKQEWDVTAATTGKEFYSFFQTSIS